MPRIRHVVVFLIIITCAWGLSCANAEEQKLIRVTISSHEAAVVAPSKAVAPKAVSSRPPTPREQMYVFWLIGKVLSYPVDSVESYVTGLLNGPLPGPVAQPASANSISTLAHAPPSMARAIDAPSASVSVPCLHETSPVIS